MLKLSGNIKRTLPLLLLGIIPFMVLLNWIIFGSAYFTSAILGLAGSGISFLVIFLVFLVCRHIIRLLRHRFPSDNQFIKRVMIQVTVFLLLSALVLVGLFSLYRFIGLIDSVYETKLTWAFIATGIINIFMSFVNEALNVLGRWKTGLLINFQVPLLKDGIRRKTV